jgi:phosphoribosylformylglycinamidine (FGAM) synthase-like amidotransferase family enzyme
MHCIQCGRELNERIETVWTKVLGWEKRRNQGGTNHLALRQQLDLYCCNGCMTLMQQGLNPGQQSLMDNG